MKSNKFLLEQSGQSYLVKDAKGVTKKIGDLPTSGTDGKSILTGSGDPSASFGLNGEVYIDIDNFKLFTKSGGSWSAGTNFNGRSVLFGNGVPSDSNGRNLESYIDLDNFKIHTKSAGGSWNAGSLFKGTDGNNGNDGARGKTTLQGAGPPGTGSNLGTATAALNDALTDVGLTSGDLQAGDLYLDTTNHIFYKKTALGWTTKGTTFRPQKFKGLLSSLSDSGDEGDTAMFNNIVYTRSGGAWSSTGASTKGDPGDNGLRGKTTLQGAGPPGSGANLATPTAALTDALSDADLASGDLQAGDLYLDTTNHAFYKKTSSGWATRGTTFRPQKFKGLLSSLSDSGDEGDSAIFNNLVYTRSGGAWSSTGASTKGDPGNDGNDGARGKTTLEGSGPPGTSTNYATPTAALASALSEAGITSDDLATGDIYMDTTNHFVYKKTSAGWSKRVTTFKGADGTNGTKFKGILSALSDSGDENDTGIFNNKIYKRVGSSWVDQSVSVKGDKGDAGDTGATGPGVKVYSVALGSDSSTADTALTTSFADMYLADVMTNEGSILTATSSKGSTTSFTMSSTGRYKIEIQAAVRAVNYNTSTTYNPTVTIRILNSSTSTALLDSTVTLLTGTATSGGFGNVQASTDSDTLSISRIFRFTSGTVIKIQAKTSTLTSSSPTKLTYLQLATDSEAVGSADTVVTFTKL